MNYRDLEVSVQNQIQNILEGYWGQTFDIDDLDDYYSNSGMRYGYIAIDKRFRTIMICDCTPDDGDTLIATVRY